jgi:uncharacterized protein (TIGR02996 family)
VDTENALLRAALADPDDEFPRLAYADWLDERGDPRSELIRIESALRGPEGSLKQRAMLEDRFRYLRAKFGDPFNGVALVNHSLQRCWLVKRGRASRTLALQGWAEGTVEFGVQGGRLLDLLWGPAEALRRARNFVRVNGLPAPDMRLEPPSFAYFNIPGPCGPVPARIEAHYHPWMPWPPIMFRLFITNVLLYSDGAWPSTSLAATGALQMPGA